MRFNNIFPFIYRDDYFMEKYNITLPQSFDHENKYLLLVDNNISYIKLRLKDSDIWSTILTKLLGEKIYIINDYETNNKVISTLYNKMKEQYRLPTNYLEAIKQCKYLNYYYSNDERDQYIKSWIKKIDPFYKSYSETEYSHYCKISNENSVYNSIQLDHYIDNGCLCRGCCMKRINILRKHKNGVKITEKIKHVDLPQHQQMHPQNILTKKPGNINDVSKKNAYMSDDKRKKIIVIPKKSSNNISLKIW